VLDSDANGESFKADKASDKASDKATMYTCNEVISGPDLGQSLATSANLH
jgi:hypothetical protein